MSRFVFPPCHCFLCVLIFALAGHGLSGSVKVSNGRILKGSSFCVPTNGMATFSCTIENPDSVSHKVRLRILPPSENVNNPEVSVPGKSKLAFRAPIYVNRWEKYHFDVFQDGKQLPGSVLNECTIQLPDSAAESVGFLNDTGDTIGGLNKNTQLPRRFVPLVHRGGDWPENWREYDRLRMLVVCTPDYSKCTSAQFSAVMEYVAQGGMLVFVNPQGVMGAASTPLADLLPVRPLRIRKVSRVDGIEALVGGSFYKGLGGREIEFLDSVETSADKGVTFAWHEGFPVMREWRYGLGTVRVLAVFPNRSTFPDNNAFADRLVARALAMPLCQPSFQSFRRPLDHLTGFSIPDVSLVEALLGVYFVSLIVVFLVLKRIGRGGWSWVGIIALSLGGTAGILFYANRTLGTRGALMAEVRVDNGMMPGCGHSFVSLYASQAGKTSFQGENRRSLLGCIPRNPTALKERFEMQRGSLSPMDIRVGADGVMSIRELTFGARTSRQYLEFRSGSQAAESVYEAVSAPRLLLGRNGMTLERWRLPEGLRNSEAFMLFPNGSQAVEVDAEGFCTLKEDMSMLTDPFLTDLRQGLERSCGKLHPSLVVVTEFKPQARGTFPKMTLQGKRLILYPADLVPAETGVQVPTELLVFSPDHAVSSLMLDGNRLTTDHSFMGDFYARISVSLPSSLGELQVDGLRVRLRISNTERIRPDVKFLIDGNEKRPLRGKADEAGNVVFSGKELAQVFDRETLSGTLLIEGKMLPRGEQEQDFSANNWSILELGVTAEGTLPKRLVRKSL